MPEPKRLVLFPDAGHEDLLIHDPRRFVRAVSSFLREFSRPPSAPDETASRIEIAEKIVEQSE